MNENSCSTNIGFKKKRTGMLRHNRINPLSTSSTPSNQLGQRGPTTGPRMEFVRPAEQFCTSLVDHKQYDKAWRADGRPIPSERPFFFFFGERYDFATKIGIFSRLRLANSNNFKKWPTRVQKLDHPELGCKTNLQAFSFQLQRFTKQCHVSATMRNKVMFLR